MSDQHEQWMQQALRLAMRAESEGEVPVGAVIVKDNELVAEGWNRPIVSHDASAHAEIQAVRAAGQVLGNYRLTECTLYVTLEPCAMCAGAIIHARLKHVIFGASDPRAGAVGSIMNLFEDQRFNHQPGFEGGVLAEECGQLLKHFFRRRRR